MVFIYLEEIIEIPTYILCRLHGSVDIHMALVLLKRWECSRKNGQLYLRCQCKVTFYIYQLAVFLLCFLYKVYFRNGLVYRYLQVFKVYWLCGEIKGAIVH